MDSFEDQMIRLDERLSQGKAMYPKTVAGVLPPVKRNRREPVELLFTVENV